MQLSGGSARRYLWVLAFAAGLLLLFAVTAGSAPPDSSGDLALVGAKVYPTPRAFPITNAAILIHDGKIVAVGRRDDVEVPKSAYVLDCSGRVITAGFWNSHVHFTEPVWSGAADAPAAKLEEHMQTMLTKWGFTTVFDIGSIPQDTLALRKRVESGELLGPKIYTTGAPIYPENGIPVYVPPDIARLLKPFEAATPADATRIANADLALGADGIKLFSGAIMGQGKIMPMPVEVVRGAVAVAHAAGKPVFAHPSNHVGTDNALAGGVDILAHTTPIEGEFTENELIQMKAQHTALIPTLTLWQVELERDKAPVAAQQKFVQAGVDELKTYFAQGGTILFGTDVGYTQHYDTTTEYEYMGRAGMNWRDVLASLTTSPAKFFKAAHTGEVVPGYAGDLVVLDADPAVDLRNFAKVGYTIRAGKIIYQK